MQRNQIPEELNGFPFRIVVFRTKNHGKVLLSCRYNKSLYPNPAAQIREQEAETFADPEFVVLGEYEINREEFCHA